MQLCLRNGERRIGSKHIGSETSPLAYLLNSLYRSSRRVCFAKHRMIQYFAKSLFHYPGLQLQNFPLKNHLIQFRMLFGHGH